MRSGIGWRFAASAACVAAAMGCSDAGDPDTDIDSLQGQGGSGMGGSSSGAGGGGTAAGSGGMSAGGRSGAGGSAGAVGGRAGAPSSVGGAAGATGGSGGAAAGSGGAAGAGEGPPDAGGPDPDPTEEEVGFSDVFQLLVTRCGGCHGANAPGNRPRFAQANNQAASFAATELMSQGALVSSRIVTRAVVTRNMPPACGQGALGTGQCLSVADAALLQAWVDQGAQE